MNKNYFWWRTVVISNSVRVIWINLSCLIENYQRFHTLSILFRFYDNVDKYFGPLHYSRLDHVAYTIMKGRDYGLPDYNTVREQIGLRRMKSFEDINPRLARDNPSVQKKSNVLMKSIDQSINQPTNQLYMQWVDHQIIQMLFIIDYAGWNCSKLHAFHLSVI